MLVFIVSFKVNFEIRVTNKGKERTNLCKGSLYGKSN